MNYKTPARIALNRLMELHIDHKNRTPSLPGKLVWQNVESGQPRGTVIPNRQGMFRLVYFTPPPVTGSLSSVLDKMAAIGDLKGWGATYLSTDKATNSL